MKTRHSEEQIIQAIKEHQAVTPVAELCRRYGVSQPTFYKWRHKFDGLEVSDAKRLRLIEDENRKLKKLVAGRSNTA